MGRMDTWRPVALKKRFFPTGALSVPVCHADDRPISVKSACFAIITDFLVKNSEFASFVLSGCMGVCHIDRNYLIFYTITFKST